jgi:hypothetical protein
MIVALVDEGLKWIGKGLVFRLFASDSKNDDLNG